MDDYALVLNAGSSSLKFCVFERPSKGTWRLEARGQIEGIGSLARLSVTDFPRSQSWMTTSLGLKRTKCGSMSSRSGFASEYSRDWQN